MSYELKTMNYLKINYDDDALHFDFILSSFLIHNSGTLEELIAHWRKRFCMLEEVKLIWVAFTRQKFQFSFRNYSFELFSFSILLLQKLAYNESLREMEDEQLMSHILKLCSCVFEVKTFKSLMLSCKQANAFRLLLLQKLNHKSDMEIANTSYFDLQDSLQFSLCMLVEEYNLHFLIPIHKIISFIYWSLQMCYDTIQGVWLLSR